VTAARRLRAASVQMEHRDGDREANFTKIERFVAEAAAQGAQLVVFPECCVCGYWFIRNLSIDELTALAEPIPEGPSTQRLRELAQRYRITVGAGWVESTDPHRMGLMDPALWANRLPCIAQSRIVSRMRYNLSLWFAQDLSSALCPTYFHRRAASWPTSWRRLTPGGAGAVTWSSGLTSPFHSSWARPAQVRRCSG
jgi:predicted amidohydrolase